MTHFHGSDLEKIEAAYGIKKETIINFSSNVNPLGLSESIKTYLPQKIELIASYPDRNYLSLRCAIGNYIHMDSENIIVGNGSTELISLCIKAISPKKSLIIGPTYSEYEREVGLCGGSSAYYPLQEKNEFEIDIMHLKNSLTTDLDLLVICNPNNPTSTAITTSVMKEILIDCKKKNIFVLIDETYVEFVHDVNNVSAVQLVHDHDNVMVIRGVSKFFAAPGLRLGYAVCSSRSHILNIERQKNPWTINALAAFAGELMLMDKEYILKTHQHIADERKKIVTTLSKWDFVKFIDPVANFVLVKILNESFNASKLFNALLERKLMIRDASSFPFLDEQYFRFCFLHSAQNDLLLKSIEEILK
ncbi:MAG: threonine-phosphate decarboxylase [Firmicutes bacterium HGW-Firmicutes-1]|jgi:threonine-phosphate decarboxylase|nr:MAG: threonine-phosphate decarboxylase [Firmicutes bacterium HGW-Firmicutes-1]